ncbi:hypothetical protein [Komagataeibacter europaeus]|uniref:hypothetical protein n=1 Tax=Komagataeibacter europaeus TaxID=33995 RepID=UPI0012DEB019|nr:hypothetical protein [Komagataeibacter europaeus]
MLVLFKNFRIRLLMQQICLQFCFKFNKREKLKLKEKVEISDNDLKDILEQAASYVDYSSLVQKMHEGPKTRGTERKEYNIIDGSKGDIYRVILFSISQDPPQFSIPYDSLLQRVESVCNGDVPAGRSITSTCQAIQGFAESLHPQQRIIEWDEETGNGTLSISDPYLLFYIRSSRKLDDLKMS